MVIDVLSQIGRAILPEAVRRALRGSSNSVRNRFYDHPVQRLSLWWHYKKGGTYLDWYSARLEKANENDHVSEIDVNDKLRNYLETGFADLDVLKNFGMEPKHRFHEIGFGHGRSAKFIIEYLDEGKYSGNDITLARVKFARDLVEKFGLSDKNPALIHNQDNSFDWVDDTPVDFLFANAVFGHMPPEDVEEILQNMKKIMKPGSVFLFTWSNRKDKQSLSRLSVKDWLRNEVYWEQLAQKYGYECEHVSEVLPDKYVPRFAALTKYTIK
jgi:SAM-dependent methyltransferase